MLHIVSLSPQAFTVRGDPALGSGERVILALPAIGRIEAFVAWRSHGRVGFQFERLLRPREFASLIEAIRPAAPPPEPDEAMP